MKRFLPVLLFVCCAFAFSITAEAQTNPRLAVLPFSGGDEGEGDTISMLLSNQAVLRTAFTLLPRTSNIEMLMQEHDIERSGLTDSDTIAELGKQLNADFVVSGHIQRLGDRNLVHITIVGVESLQQIAGTYQEYGTIEDIRGLLPDMAAKLATAANLDTRYLPKLAVLPFDIPASVNLQDAETLAQLLATELANSRKYAVLPRTRTIEAAMAEQDIQRSGLTDPNSIKAIGKATNADYVLTGTVTNLGSLNLFVAQILNVEDGSMLTGDDREYQTITDGLTLMPQMSDKLTGLQDERERARIAELARQQQQEAERQRQEAERQAQAEQQRLAEQQWLETERQRVAQEAADSAAKQVAWKSQWLYLGVRGGMSIRSYTMSQKSELASADLTFTEGFVGFEGSLQIALQLLPINNLASFALQTELIIASDKLAFKSSTKTASGRFLTGSFEFSALQVPLMVKFSYRPANFLLAGFAGVYLTIPTSDMQVTLKGTLNDGSTNSSYSAPLGIVFGANAGLKLGPGALFADLRGAIDTGDTVHKNDTPLFHRVALSLSLGYEIGLFNRRKN